MTTVWMVSMLLMANLLTCILRIYYRKEFTVRNSILTNYNTVGNCLCTYPPDGLCSLYFGKNRIYFAENPICSYSSFI
jgi:hypothetical protein